MESHGGEKPGGSINLCGRMVFYQVRESKRAKNLSLVVGPSGLEVVVPCDYKQKNLEDVLLRKQKWILKKIEHFNSFYKSFNDNKNKVLYRGRDYLVETRLEPGSHRKVQIEEEKILVILPEGAEGEAGAALEYWFRSMARLLINQRIRVINQTLKLSYNRIFIKGQKTRWGSCSRQKNLNFNWRLVMAPLPVLDYVVAHELLHLVEPNHSTKFWALVEKTCPDYKKHRAWLKNNGWRLVI